MATDQVAAKSSAWLLAMFGVAVSPILGDWMLVMVGAVGGALLELSYRAEPEKVAGWWRPLLRMGSNVVAALVFTQFLVAMLPEAIIANKPEAALIAIAALVAYGWRHILPAVVLRISSKTDNKP